MAQYDLGDSIRITGTFTDAAGTATDPAVVTFTYTDPNGTSTTYTYGADAELVKSSTGVYYVDIVTSLEGAYYWRWVSTGAGAAADEGQFWVTRTVVRAGMQKLINRVRALTGAQASEYTAGDVTYWTDEQIQSTLDSNVTYVLEAPLTFLTENVNGTTVYKVAQSPYRDLEEADSGTPRWIVRDSEGTENGTVNYTVDYRSGRITWSSDQGGTSYYLTGYSYDIHAAAADIWLERLAHFQDWYRFSADNQTFDRQQAFEHAEKMERRMREQTGKNIVAQATGDLRVSQFVRVDLNQRMW